MAAGSSTRLSSSVLQGDRGSRPVVSRPVGSLLGSHSGSSDVLLGCPRPGYRVELVAFGTLVLLSLRLSLNATDAMCECGARLDTLGRRSANGTDTLARVCREAGASVRVNAKPRDMTVEVRVDDERAIEVLASGLPIHQGAQTGGGHHTAFSTHIWRSSWMGQCCRGPVRTKRQSVRSFIDGRWREFRGGDLPIFSIFLSLFFSFFSFFLLCNDRNFRAQVFVTSAVEERRTR